jgi:hypothetical protein
VPGHRSFTFSMMAGDITSARARFHADAVDDAFRSPDQMEIEQSRHRDRRSPRCMCNVSIDGRGSAKAPGCRIGPAPQGLLSRARSGGCLVRAGQKVARARQRSDACLRAGTEGRLEPRESQPLDLAAYSLHCCAVFLRAHRSGSPAGPPFEGMREGTDFLVTEKPSDL